MFLAFQPFDFIVNNAGFLMPVLLDDHAYPMFIAKPIGLTL
jgi:hypothetical protein